MPSSPTLAACLMVRNEADHLRRCLASVAGAVDAIYVTDTGSTDDSAAVARSFGATVREFPWGDDFAAARNASLAGVAEDWILTLDADDAFPAGEAVRLRGLLAPDACAATVRYVVGPTHTPLRTVKLLRNRLRARYEGLIHESLRTWLAAQLAEGWRRQDLPVTLVHWGYTPEARPGKLARNLPLLRREWARLSSRRGEAAGASGHDRIRLLTSAATQRNAARYHIGAELGLALAHAGQSAEGGELLGQLLTEVTAAAPVPGAAALKILASLLWVLGEAGQAEAALTAVRRVEAPLAEVPAYQLHRGLTELAAENHAVACAWLERFRTAWTADELDVPVPTGYPGARLWDALAHCHLGQRDYAAAAVCHQRGIELNPADRELPLRLLVAQRLMSL